MAGWALGLCSLLGCSRGAVEIPLDLREAVRAEVDAALVDFSDHQSLASTQHLSGVGNQATNTQISSDVNRLLAWGLLIVPILSGAFILVLLVLWITAYPLGRWLRLRFASPPPGEPDVQIVEMEPPVPTIDGFRGPG